MELKELQSKSGESGDDDIIKVTVASEQEEAGTGSRCDAVDEIIRMKIAVFARWIMICGALTLLIGDSTTSTGALVALVVPSISGVGGGMGLFFASKYSFVGDSSPNANRRAFAITKGSFFVLGAIAFVLIALGLFPVARSRKSKDAKSSKYGGAARVWETLRWAAKVGLLVTSFNIFISELWFAFPHAPCDIEGVEECSVAPAIVTGAVYAAAVALFAAFVTVRETALSFRPKLTVAFLYCVVAVSRASEILSYDGKQNPAMKASGWIILVAGILGMLLSCKGADESDEASRMASIPFVASAIAFSSAINDFYASGIVEGVVAEYFKNALVLEAIFSCFSCLCLLALCRVLCAASKNRASVAFQFRCLRACFFGLGSQSAARAVRALGGGRIVQTMFSFTGRALAGDVENGYVQGANYICENDEEGCAYYRVAGALSIISCILFFLAGFFICARGKNESKIWISLAVLGAAFCMASLSSSLLYDNRIECVIWIANCFVSCIVAMILVYVACAMAKS